MSNFLSEQTLTQGRQVFVRFTFANATDRGNGVPSGKPNAHSGTITSADIGAVAMMDDDDTFWILQSVGPLVWVQLGVGGTDVNALHIAGDEIGSVASGTLELTDLLVWADVSDSDNHKSATVSDLLALATTGAAFPEYLFVADSLDSCLTANWAVNGNAPVSADTVNAALNVRRMDDTAEEGFGKTLYVPVDATNMQVEVQGRAQSTPGGAVVVKLLSYERELPDDGPATAWGSSVALDDFDLTADLDWQVVSTDKTLAAWGIAAGQTHQLQWTRTSTGNTLAGDFVVKKVRVTFSS